MSAHLSGVQCQIDALPDVIWYRAPHEMVGAAVDAARLAPGARTDGGRETVRLSRRR